MVCNEVTEAIGKIVSRVILIKQVFADCEDAKNMVVGNGCIGMPVRKFSLIHRDLWAFSMMNHFIPEPRMMSASIPDYSERLNP